MKNHRKTRLSHDADLPRAPYGRPQLRVQQQHLVPGHRAPDGQRLHALRHGTNLIHLADTSQESSTIPYN